MKGEDKGLVEVEVFGVEGVAVEVVELRADEVDVAEPACEDSPCKEEGFGLPQSFFVTQVIVRHIR